MTMAYIFPGQASQHVGMGKALFEQFPEYVKQADDCLGYSLMDICLNGPESKLSQTQYTQPALYCVSALAYMAKVKEAGIKPDYVAGHSLGEFSALFAAGAFDFITGLKLVIKRGELMSKADKGAMAAVIGCSLEKVKGILEKSELEKIEIANINSPDQTILSGAEDELNIISNIFKDSNIKFILLNVSAAFHSSFMLDAQIQFKVYLDKFELNSLKIPVVSNLTAREYPKDNYKSYIVDQITGSINWYESISWLLNKGVNHFEELGAGLVLSKFLKNIQEKPLSFTSKHNDKDLSLPKVSVEEKDVLFMFDGSNSYYPSMLKDLYLKNTYFRREMDQCNSVILFQTGLSVVEFLYENNNIPSFVENNELLQSLSTFSVAYCLSQLLTSQGLKPTKVLGLSTGEFVALVVAGCLSLYDAVKLIINKVYLLSECKKDEAMLSVLNSTEDIDKHQKDYAGCHLSVINCRDYFVVGGEKEDILVCRGKLNRRGIINTLLPSHTALNCESLKRIEDAFLVSAKQGYYKSPDIAIYSPATGEEISSPDAEHVFKAVFDQVDFMGLMSNILIGTKHEAKPLIVDLSSNALLSASISRDYKNSCTNVSAVNKFGDDFDSVNKLLLGLCA